MPFVLDASLTLTWFFEDELPARHPIAIQALSILDYDRAVVPSIWALEVANALRLGERRGRTTHSEATQFVNQLATLPISDDITTREQVFGPILALARQYDLTAYDASYLELAIREQLPLATLDNALTRAAREAGVELLA